MEASINGSVGFPRTMLTKPIGKLAGTFSSVPAVMSSWSVFNWADDGTYSPEELSREIYMEAAKKLFGILSIFFLLFTLYHLL